MSPRSVRVREPLTLTATLADVPLAVRVGRKVRSVDAHVLPHLGQLGAKWVYDQAIRRHWGQQDTPTEVINLSEVREVHRRVMEPVWRTFPPDGAKPGEGPGGFRECDIEPLRPGLIPPSWTDLMPRLTDWLETMAHGPQDGGHFLEYLADLHAEFERIHPFRDGNGRVGRLVVNLILVRYGAPPAILDKRGRAKYLRALARADDGDPGPLAEVLARTARESVERFLLPALAGPQRFVPLRSRQSAARRWDDRG